MRKSLDRLGKNKRGIIVEIRNEEEFKKRLWDMGIVVGAEVFVQRIAPFYDPIEIYVKGYFLALRKQDCKKIIVEEIV